MSIVDLVWLWKSCLLLNRCCLVFVYKNIWKTHKFIKVKILRVTNKDRQCSKNFTYISKERSNIIDKNMSKGIKSNALVRLKRVRVTFSLFWKASKRVFSTWWIAPTIKRPFLNPNWAEVIVFKENAQLCIHWSFKYSREYWGYRNRAVVLRKMFISPFLKIRVILAVFRIEQCNRSNKTLYNSAVSFSIKNLPMIRILLYYLTCMFFYNNSILIGNLIVGTVQ